ncbi:hypothetical protein E2C01_035619 [Portunus trituberculatus]|uniref:Uncharacterized protein n=1 Tax=Portunus trituberculatus TaxID=210409 RepID=A0A5B7F9N0_PORTR|nr:hypothetical protein [Portunus trituberculatus]
MTECTSYERWLEGQEEIEKMQELEEEFIVNIEEEEEEEGEEVGVTVVACHTTAPSRLESGEVAWSRDSLRMMRLKRFMQRKWI